MAFSATLSYTSFPSLPRFPQTLRTKSVHCPLIRAVQGGEAESKSEGSSNVQSSSAAAALRLPRNPSIQKGQIVRVYKEKYLSVNYLSVGHPPYYKGLYYIYEDRGEIAWVGVPTAPAWLPTDMFIKSEKLNYERL